VVPADAVPAEVAVADVVPVEVGVGVGDPVPGGFVCCGVTVCRGVAVRCGDGTIVGVGELCGVRWAAGRFVCEGAGDEELVCCGGVGVSLAVPEAGGLTHA
jgi:hypothetical protein